MSAYDYLVVGAGFAGCVLAERLASQLDKKILLIDRRSHVAGNAFDSYDNHGILIHNFGPHIFHTNDEGVFQYLSQFTEWRPYEHRVLSSVSGKLVPIPINRKTVNDLFELELKSDADVSSFFDRERVPVTAVTDSENFVVSRVGRRLYELLYRGYTTKQWGLEPKDLSPSVCGRLPIRTNVDDRYFDDRYQAMPKNGYTEMFKRMIAHPNIELALGTEFRDMRAVKFNKLIFTGPIDEFFNFTYGKLPYRSLRFEFDTLDREYVQPVAIINYPNTHAYTRTVEFKHLTGQVHPKTTISREYPMAESDPYYPVPRPENAELYQRYKRDADKLRSVIFVGRLASYQYYNMDQVTAQSLAVFERIARGDL